MDEKKINSEKERKSTEPERKEKLVIEGNAFYEIDLECVKEKQRQSENRKAGWKMKNQKR